MPAGIAASCPIANARGWPTGCGGAGGRSMPRGTMKAYMGPAAGRGLGAVGAAGKGGASASAERGSVAGGGRG